MRRFKRKVQLTPAGELTFVQPVWSPRQRGVVMPIPEEVEELAKDYARKVDELIERHRKTAILAELQAQLRAYRQFLSEASDLYFEGSQLEDATPAVRLVKEYIQARDKLSRYIDELRKKIARLEGYLTKRKPVMVKPSATRERVG